MEQANIQIPEVQAARDPGEKRSRRRRQVTPQERISERIPEQIVDVPQAIP